MLRRMLALIRRDLAMSVRDFILAYGLLAPFLLGLVLRAVLPAASPATGTLVVTSELGTEMAGRLREYVRVEIVAGRAALERRVLGLDDAVGVLPDGGSYRLVFEGNETEEARALPVVILADILAAGGLGPSAAPETGGAPEADPGSEAGPASEADPASDAGPASNAGPASGAVAIEIVRTDLGRPVSPLKPTLTILLVLTTLLVAGMVVGFNIIEDKESGALYALAVTPLSRLEYVAGRSVLGLILGVTLVFGALYAMGAGPFDPLQVLVAGAAGTAAAILYGLYTGAVADNQVAGIATIKFGGLFFTAAPFLAAAVPARFHQALWWLPTYWNYRAFAAALAGGDGSWAAVWRFSLVTLAVVLVYVAASWRLLRRKLAVRG